MIGKFVVEEFKILKGKIVEFAAEVTCKPMKALKNISKRKYVQNTYLTKDYHLEYI
jgi:hypothetical protein